MTVLFCGIGLIAAGFAVIVAREVAGGIVVGQLVDQESVKPAAERAWSISTSLMTSIATTVIVIGVLFGVAGWLASPTGSAKATRRYLAPALREYPAYVYAALAVVVGIYFLSAPTQNLRTFLTTLVVAGLTAFGIHELRKQAQEEHPDDDLRRSLRRHQGQGGGGREERQRDHRRAGVEAETAGGAATERGGDGAAAASVDPEDARLERLERLASLHEKGVLTDEELAAEKARLLNADD